MSPWHGGVALAGVLLSCNLIPLHSENTLCMISILFHPFVETCSMVQRIVCSGTVSQELGKKAYSKIIGSSALHMSVRPIWLIVLFKSFIPLPSFCLFALIITKKERQKFPAMTANLYITLLLVPLIYALCISKLCY